MTKEQYLKKLSRGLKKLPPEEREDAIQYYTEYFQDTPASEAEAIKTLGSPSQVASSILADYRIGKMEQMDSPTRKGLSAAGTIILSIFAAPIALPIAIVLAALALVVLLTLGIVLLLFWIIGVSSALGGVALFVLGISVLFVQMATALFLFGSGLALFGFGVLATIGMFYLTRKLGRSIVSYVKRKRSGKGEIIHE